MSAAETCPRCGCAPCAGEPQCYDEPTCPRCKCCGMSWQACERCDGDGAVEDVDPIDGGQDFVTCEDCCGSGGWWRCGCDEQGRHAP